MEPTDNFSQKKKNDLVAIASLFGILTEEKANRMTKPELIEFLQEQDRKSRTASEAAPVKAAEIPAVEIPEKEAKQPAVISAVKPTVKSAVKPAVKSAIKAEDKAADKAEDKVAVKALVKTEIRDALKKPAAAAKSKISKPAKKPLAESPSKEVEVPEMDLLLVSEEKFEPSRTADISSDSLSAISDAKEADIPVSTDLPEEAEPVLKKRRGRPKKAAVEMQDDTTVPEPVTSEKVMTRKEIIRQEELDPEEVISLEVEFDSSEDDISRKSAYSEPSEQWIQQTVPVWEHSAPVQPLTPPAEAESAEPAPAAVSKAAPKAAPAHTPANTPADQAHHIGRTKRHSVIIKPKDEEFSSQGQDLQDENGQDDDFQRSSTDQKEYPETSGSSAASGEHTEFGSHHARTLRPKEQPQEMLSGVLELMSEGYGFLRRENYLQGLNDIYVPAQYVRRFGLRVGDYVTGPCRPKRDSDRYQSLQYIKEVNGLPPEKMLRRVHFDRLTPIYPDEKYILETDKTELSTRIIDLVAPIGKGQRGMIVSPPKAGKTILLQKIANAISINNPDSKLIVLLIDERPEEVTDMQRSINGEVVYSTFDKTPENHVRIVELVLERAERLVELGQDVVILLDSMTRLARAYNLTINPTGRTLSGGLDPGALYGPKRFFGAARNIEGGGSLTIVATSLVDTGSRMDEVIFEEFKGTGNMEVCLDRKLSEKRIFPAIDINKSGTRHEELLMTPVELDAVWTIRKAFGQLDTTAVTEMIINLLLKTTTNNQFIQSVNISFNDKATFDAMRGTRPAGNSTNTSSGGMGNGNGK